MNPDDPTRIGDEANAGDEDYPEFSDVISILRRGPSDVRDETPSEALWHRIEAGLEFGDTDLGDTDTDGDGSDRESTAEPVVSEPAPDRSVRLVPIIDSVSDRPTVTPLTDARSRRSVSTFTAAIVGIAAALLVVALPLGLAYRSSRGPDSTAELAAISELPAMGQAEIDGRVLTVDTEGLTPNADASYELWLLDLEDSTDTVNALVSVGVIEADGTFEIPESVDLDTFNVIDISVEPHDGNPQHSGASVLRGELA